VKIRRDFSFGNAKMSSELPFPFVEKLPARQTSLFDPGLSSAFAIEAFPGLCGDVRNRQEQAWI
jgi:hypothetical protein